MAWVSLTETDLLGRLSDPEITAFKSAATRGSEGDVIDRALDEAIDLARGYIAVKYSLGAAGTIPQKLKGPVLDVAVITVMTRAAGIVIDPQGERKAAKDDALRIFGDIAAGRFAVEEPTTADGETIGALAPTGAGRDAAFGQEFEDGI